MALELWTEKYRPRSIEEYVWRDEAQRVKVAEWVSEGALPHILFTGLPGTGKTSLAELLLILLGIPKGDILRINASRDRKIEDIQAKVVSFVGTWALGPTGIKYILLDEADRMSMLAQDLLRGELERYNDICRFVLTCNNPAGISGAMKSRLQCFTFNALDRNEFTARAGEIMARENVQFELDDLFELVNVSYPDLRKCIHLAQQNTVDGVFTRPKAEDTALAKDFLVEAASLFKAKRNIDARKLIVSSALIEDYPDIYRYMYRNLELWGDTEDQKDEALLAIRRGLVYHQTCGDPEINLSATLVELVRIRQKT